MRPKKFYFPIGILLVVICAVGLLSLRSDVPTEPHTEETTQEKFEGEMSEKAAHLKQEVAKYKAETAKYKAELDTLNAKAAERTEYPSRITEKGKESINTKSLEQQLVDTNYAIKRLKLKISDLREGKEF